MKSRREFCILTNNPMVEECLGSLFEVRLFPDLTYREILIKARDLVYIGHRLYTHPLAGSVKPNETPFRSIVLSRKPRDFSAEEAEILSNAVLTCDKFPPRKRELSESLLQDFQLIDYVLVAGALDVDAAAGLSTGTS